MSGPRLVQGDRHMREARQLRRKTSDPVHSGGGAVCGTWLRIRSERQRGGSLGHLLYTIGDARNPSEEGRYLEIDALGEHFDLLEQRLLGRGDELRIGVEVMPIAGQVPLEPGFAGRGLHFSL